MQSIKRLFSQLEQDHLSARSTVVRLSSLSVQTRGRIVANTSVSAPGLLPTGILPTLGVFTRLIRVPIVLG